MLHKPNATFWDEYADEHLHADDYDWNHGISNPLLFSLREHIIKPGETSLVYGIGQGREGIFFALHGMNVVGIDISEKNITGLNEKLAESELPINVILADAKSYISEQPVQHICLNEFLVHFTRFEEVVQMLEIAINNLKPGGTLFANIPAFHDTGAQRIIESRPDMLHPAVRDAQNPHILLMTCGCSGEIKEEPVMLAPAHFLLEFFTTRGFKIIYHSTQPFSSGEPTYNQILVRKPSS